MHCVDLGESFPTHILLQNLALVQPITIPAKFARSPRTDPPGAHEHCGSFGSAALVQGRPLWHGAAITGNGDAGASGFLLRTGLPHRSQSGTFDLADAWWVRSEVNNSLIIVNFFHKIQNFRQISDLFSQI